MIRYILAVFQVLMGFCYAGAVVGGSLSQTGATVGIVFVIVTVLTAATLVKRP